MEIKCPPPVGIGLTDLPNIGGASCSGSLASPPPVPTSLQIFVLEYRKTNLDIPIFRAKNEPPTWPSGGAQRLKNLFGPFDGAQSLKSVGEEV